VKDDEQPESTPKNIPGNSTAVGADTNRIGSHGNAKELPFQGVAHTIMERNGPRKLVLSSKTKAQPVASADISGDSVSENDKQSQRQTMTREGRNKLVSLTTSTATRATGQKEKTLTNFLSDDFKHNRFRGRQNNTSSISGPINRGAKLEPPPKILRPKAKRIRLSANRDAKSKDEDLDCNSPSSRSTSPAAVGTAMLIKSKPTEKLSDFAYKEVGRVRQQPIIPSQNLHWSKKSNNESCNKTNSLPPSTFTGKANKRPKIKNMGLVRIQPDKKTTPICPTFLRGLHCQNEFCRKRHDIPKEHAMPVCSFFQRHGQCLRGDVCVFRHVKVNPKALVCPSFAILGFCEDEKCTMQHINGPKNTGVDGTNGTCKLATGRSPPQFRRTPKNVYIRNKQTSGDRAKET
jgi:hypothetical protein